jgi:hypothetical protein
MVTHAVSGFKPRGSRRWPQRANGRRQSTRPQVCPGLQDPCTRRVLRMREQILGNHVTDRQNDHWPLDCRPAVLVQPRHGNIVLDPACPRHAGTRKGEREWKGAKREGKGAGTGPATVAGVLQRGAPAAILDQSADPRGHLDPAPWLLLSCLEDCCHPALPSMPDSIVALNCYVKLLISNLL